MRSGSSLNLKGVRPDAIETAREAARRSGQSLGQWINSAIIGTAAESGIRPRGPKLQPHDSDRLFDDSGFVAVNERLDHLAMRLDRLATQNPDRVAPARGVDAEPACNAVPSLRALESRLTSIVRELAPQSQATSHRIADAITRLNARLDQLIVERPASSDLDRRVAAVDRALAALNGGEPAKPRATAADPFGLDGAIAEISARQRVLDAGAPEVSDRDDPAPAHPDLPRVEPSPPIQDLSGLEQQLRHITEQLETLRRPCSVEDQVSGLRRELADIGRTLTEALPRRILEGLQAEIRALPERIDVGEEDGPEAAELSTVERGLAEIRDALNALAPAESIAGFDEEVKALSRKIDLLAANGLDPEILRQLEHAIAELRAIAGRVASGEALSALATDVRAIGTKLDHFIDAGSSSGARDIETLARRIEALAASLEARAGHSGHDIPANFEVLINTLTDKLEASRRAGPDHAAFDQLQDQIVRLAQKLDASDGRFGNLGAIERAIADLMAQLKDARANAIETAQHAARAATKDMLDRAAGTGIEVDAIKHELVELRVTQEAIDRRTQDTLEAVHGTLERLVDRLAMIETDLHAEMRSRTSMVPAQPTIGSQPAAPSAARATTTGTAATRAAGADGRDRRPASSDLPADHPLEPGSGAPRGRAAASPAERIAASEAVLGAVKPPAPADAGGKANFIAAARRAAQAAAAEPGASHGAGDDKPQGSALADTLAKHRRALILGIGAFLLVMGTLHLANNMLGSGDRTERPAATASPPRDGATDPVTAPPARKSDVVPETNSIVPPAPGSTVGAVDVPATKPPSAPSLGVPLVIPQVSDVTGSINRPAATTPPLPRAPAAAPGSTTPPGADKVPIAIGSPTLRAAAVAGNPAAAYEIGVRYAEGRGVAQNFEEAVRWLDIAAKAGLAPAQYRLGSLYEKGQGVKKDREAARRLYAAAAEKGNGKAMHNMAVLHAEGLDGKPDYQTAAQWFRKAADHGVSDSQYNLGILYARGIGVEQNLAESYKWFALAALQGDLDAGKKRDDVAARLDPQSLVAARLAVQTWTADAQPDEAINVKAPPGGWDRAAANPPPAKPKTAAPAPRKTGSS